MPDLLRLKKFYFARYFGQQVFIPKGHKQLEEAVWLYRNVMDDYSIQNGKLQLKSLTNPDNRLCFKICEIVCPDLQMTNFTTLFQGAKILKKMNNSSHFKLTWEEYMKIEQYLYQSSYCVPFYYDGIYYSEEDLVKMKIVTLQ